MPANSWWPEGRRTRMHGRPGPQARYRVYSAARYPAGVDWRRGPHCDRHSAGLTLSCLPLILQRISLAPALLRRSWFNTGNHHAIGANQTHHEHGRHQRRCRRLHPLRRPGEGEHETPVTDGKGRVRRSLRFARVRTAPSWMSGWTGALGIRADRQRAHASGAAGIPVTSHVEACRLGDIRRLIGRSGRGSSKRVAGGLGPRMVLWVRLSRARARVSRYNERS